MKSIFLVVYLGAVVTVDCRSLVEPDPPDSQYSITEERPQWPDFTLGPQYWNETTFFPLEPPMYDDDDGQGYTDILDEGEEGIKIISADETFEMSKPSRVADVMEHNDMLLTDEQRTAMRTRKAREDKKYRWKEEPTSATNPAGIRNPLVPYVFQGSLKKGLVMDALDHWMEHTCIKFKSATKTINGINQPHLQFFEDTSRLGCYSNVGMLYLQNGQKISIRNSCNIGDVIHEIGHAIGFYHEHARSDRASYITIDETNIKDYYTDQTVEDQYMKRTDDTNLNVRYDYTSVMHYSQHGGAPFPGPNDPKKRAITIKTTDSRAQTIIGHRQELSFRDKLLANKMYNCLEKWLQKCPDKLCVSPGYTHYNEKENQCECVCPPGTSGLYCEKSSKDYYGFSTCNPPCSIKFNCENGKCTEKKCFAIGASKIVPGMDNWCTNSCLHIPPDCPETMCTCQVE